MPIGNYIPPFQPTATPETGYDTDAIIKQLLAQAEGRPSLPNIPPQPEIKFSPIEQYVSPALMTLSLIMKATGRNKGVRARALPEFLAGMNMLEAQKQAKIERTNKAYQNMIEMEMKKAEMENAGLGSRIYALATAGQLAGTEKGRKAAAEEAEKERVFEKEKLEKTLGSREDIVKYQEQQRNERERLKGTINTEIAQIRGGKQKEFTPSTILQVARMLKPDPISILMGAQDLPQDQKEKVVAQAFAPPTPEDFEYAKKVLKEMLDEDKEKRQLIEAEIAKYKTPEDWENLKANKPQVYKVLQSYKQAEQNKERQKVVDALNWYENWMNQNNITIDTSAFQ